MTEDNQIVVEVMGKRYVSVDVPFVEGKNEACKKLAKRHGLLYRAVKEINRGGFFGRTVVVQSFLCPEENYLSFANDEI